MPQRTTPFQMTVHAIRRHIAAAGVTVTESKMLADSQTGAMVEVDVVAEGDFDGEFVILAFEVTERGRKATLEWVRSMIAKHQNLPTNKLFLVSKSGFVADARNVIAAHSGRVRAVTPEIEMVDGEPVIKRLWCDRVLMTADRYRLVVQPSSEDPIRVPGDGSYDLYSADGTVVGSAAGLIQELLGGDLGTDILVEAHNRPEREELSEFSCGRDITTRSLHLQTVETGELVHVLGIEIFGSVRWVQREIPLTWASLDGRSYGAAEVDLFGLPTVWVATAADSDQTTITFRSMPVSARARTRRPSKR